MFGFFKKRNNIDADFLNWTVELAKWTIENFDGLDQIRKTVLVKPTFEFFPPSKLTGHSRAEELFLQTKKYADMDDWPCALVAQPRRAPHQLGENALQKFESPTPAGTFSGYAFGGEIHSQITYDPWLLSKPEELIATFSHELAHLLMTSAKSPNPYGEEMLEPSTDGLAIMMGFGIFILNASSGFYASDEVWECHRSGYLCEGEIFHVFSVFCILSETPVDQAKPFLKSHHYKRLRNIYEEIQCSAALNDLLG